MAQPFDYITPFQQASAGGDLLRTMQMGSQAGVLDQQRALFEAQRVAAEQKAERERLAAEQEAARQQQIEEERARFFAIPAENRTFEDYQRLSIMLPEKEAKGLRDSFDVQSKETQGKLLAFGGQVLAAFQSKSPEVGIQMLRERADAERNSGREDQAKAYETWARLAEIDPDSVSTSIGTLIAQLPGGKETLDGLKIAQETRTQREQAPLRLRELNANAQIKEAEARFAPDKFGAELGLTQAQIEASKASAASSRATAAKTSAEAGKAAAESRQIAAGIIPADKRPEAEKKFRDEYNDRTKAYQDVKSAYGRIIATEANAAGDIALIFNYMKMLDPGSTVREGEFATAQNATGAPERIRNLYNNIITGERLNPGQRKMFVGQAERLYTQARGSESQVRDGITRIARGYGLNTENIFYTPTEVAPTAPAPTAPAPSPAAPAPAAAGARGAAPAMPSGFRVIERR